MLSGLFLLSLAIGASAHYTLPALTVTGQKTGDWQYVRQADNWQNNGFVGNVASAGIRCFQAANKPAKATLEVAAGSTLGYYAAPNVYHPGPMSFWLAKAPEGETAATFNGDGDVWFKISQEQPNFGPQLTWPSNGKSTFDVKIPACIAPGEYLLRAEHIGLHAASSPGGAQFYISCAQLKITGGGTTEPTTKVSFPGAYKASDPGIQINVNYPVPTSYQNPGPAPFTC